MKKISLLLPFLSYLFFPAYGQELSVPSIIDLNEDDRVATIYWNSKTNIYDAEYDPDKLEGLYSYKVEWGKVSEGFVNSLVTPYRVHMFQPLEPGVEYMARVYSLDAFGNESNPSETTTFQHDPTRVNEMRQRLTGFFDDMNTRMGPFDERKWNQSYSGCMAMGRVSQHINQQYHGHNVIASGYCDRAVASSRVREIFDFSDRTGIIEFDLDGAQKGRQFWYLDLTPGNRKRDLTGHISLASTPRESDPAQMLRIVEIGTNVEIHMVDEHGQLRILDNVYEDGACGDRMLFCEGENLNPLINIRRHWKIELSKSHIKIYINDIKVIDGSLVFGEHTQWVRIRRGTIKLDSILL